MWDALPLAAVQDVLRRKDAGGAREDEVLEAALAWAEAQAGGGAAALAVVLPLVRLPQLSAAAKLRLRRHALYAHNAPCADLMNEMAVWAPNARMIAADLAQGRVWTPREVFDAGGLVTLGEGGFVQRYDAPATQLGRPSALPD